MDCRVHYVKGHAGPNKNKGSPIMSGKGRCAHDDPEADICQGQGKENSGPLDVAEPFLEQ